MKNTLRKTLSLFLAFTLLCSLGLTAAASEAMGEDLTSKGTLLNQKTQLSTNVFWSTAYSDLRTENVVTYEPNADVTPIVTFGDSLTTRTTVTSAARALESQGYRVAAGINGDFFNTSNGLPIGILVSEGEVLSSDGGYYAMGFREDGSAVIGKPGLSISANLGYQGSDSSGYFTDIIRTVAGINKARVSTGGIYLYTYDFNNRHTTGNTEAGVDVLCTIVEGDSALGSVKLARDSEYQGIMPVRGKILNCLKADYARIFKSEIITDLIKVLGCGVEVQNKHVKNVAPFDLGNLRWSKVVICTDGDVDGFQIRTLILTMLYRLTPTLIREGYVYIAETPLFEINSGDKTWFAYSDKEKNDIVKSLEGKKYKIDRSKGLGENDPDMMWLTTMNPETRRLIRVMPEDVEQTAAVFDLLLGDNLQGRKDHIAENGYKYLEMADIS